MSDDSRPCDTEPPAEVRHLHTATRQRIARFNEAKVADLDTERLRRDLARATTPWPAPGGGDAA